MAVSFNRFALSQTTIVVMGMIAISSSPAADVALKHVNVFTAGTEGYHTYRIPSIMVTGDGMLMAFAEGRKDHAGDPGTGNHIDTVFKRSADGGATWSPLQVLAPGGVGIAAFQPTGVVDLQAGRNRAWVFYNYRNPNPPPGRQADIGLWARFTDDNGQSWSAPVDHNDLRPAGTTNFTANIASGLQTAGGRLIIPMKTTFNGNSSQPTVLYSDDHGSNWQLGGFMPQGSNEHQIIELADGRILSNQRPNSGNTRRINISSTGGESWGGTISGPQITPVSGLERYTLAATDDVNRIVFTAPAGGGVGGNRSNLTVFTSFDEGITYINPRRIYHGPTAYSDVARNQGDAFGVLWERGDTANYQAITYTVADRHFLESGPATGSVALEGFEYTVGSLSRNIGGNGFSSTWLRDTDLTDAADGDVTAGSLPHAAYRFPMGGNHVELEGGSLARGLGTPIDLDANSTYYISLLLTRSADASPDVGSDEFFDFHLLDSTGTSHFDFGVGSDEQFRLRGLGDTVATPDDALDGSETYLLVAKIVAKDDSVGGNFDQAFLGVFKPSQTIPNRDHGLTWTVTGSTNENDNQTLDRLRISGGTNSLWSLDEIRIGTDFGSVASNLASGDVNQDGLVDGGDVDLFVANWLSANDGLSREQMARRGDLNYDGTTNLADAFLLHEELQFAGRSFPFDRLVPEPNVNALFGVIFMLAVSRKLRGRRKNGPYGH